FKRGKLVQVNIETAEINSLRPQEFCWRKRGESAQGLIIDSLGFFDKKVDKALDLPHTAPAHNFRGNLIYHTVSENCRMSPLIGHSPANCFPSVLLQGAF